VRSSERQRSVNILAELQALRGKTDRSRSRMTVVLTCVPTIARENTSLGFGPKVARSY
jgi:hypothetical protein